MCPFSQKKLQMHSSATENRSTKAEENGALLFRFLYYFILRGTVQYVEVDMSGYEPIYWLDSVLIAILKFMLLNCQRPGLDG